MTSIQSNLRNNFSIADHSFNMSNSAEFQGHTHSVPSKRFKCDKIQETKRNQCAQSKQTSQTNVNTSPNLTKLYIVS